MSERSIGKSTIRKESLEKVTGTTKYSADFPKIGLLHAKLAVSPHAHAKIISVDLSEARKVPGVKAVIIGKDHPILTGSPLEDRPPIAIDKVRYYGEPVAIVIAEQEHAAEMAALLIKVEYELLPVLHSPVEAYQQGAPLLHEQLATYKRHEEVYPEPGTNIANRTKIRKGNMEEGWNLSDHIIDVHVSLPQSDHAAMETRCCTAEILPDGKVIISSASQSPYVIRRAISQSFHIPLQKVIVHTPLVGGSFGGKAAIQLEYLAYLASSAVGGKTVKIVNSREQDMISSPVHIGLDAKIRLGCTSEGKLMAAEILYLYDSGAYSDRGAEMSKAGACDCTGPYRIDNVHCDSLCMYTNHSYATSFRGFGHPELTFAIERCMDVLAERLEIDPLEFRFLNAIGIGDTTPTQTVLDRSNIGNLPMCIAKLKTLIHWDNSPIIKHEGHFIKAKGVCCFWKNSSTPTDAGAGAIIMFNPDGSINLLCGAVEFGQGTRTALTQILAERLRMDDQLIHISMDVNTEFDPQHWKTVASRSTFLVGNAVLAAAEDAIVQLKVIASIVLECSTDELEVGGGRVFCKNNSDIGISIGKIANGYMFPDGQTIGGQVIGRGSYTMQNLTLLDPETGKGNPGPEWTVGAQAVEVELDTREYTYKIIHAATVIDAGKVINPEFARSQVTGGMSIGLSLASREVFHRNESGAILNQQFRTYKLIRYGEQPDYFVDFVETPHLEAPYGLRGIGEHGVIGMPAALANSLSAAIGVGLNQLPLTPEVIWRTKHDSF
ncbi:xanthine dehydrogenase family protein molybdopterin-binding subunit [Paenibacillus aceris]|uniref:CO/xanthine dehydrogenase Mo-binding subunit n=1 Tax=Paenibacillus aceris TaxID=869555 RepID=A0ABS4HZM3_9BACL|nr:xanthine dehydrogenase family protein molybdopterin-binding subunit [Paenibacillus aceris]MBP1964107.1 CO/xanthine dehydrogenase Mo-binding subunit [Paenibacillus aceris]NHW36443.1 xanthine dehydrogenase family protein molybdopterin-binding subunit [Paenibacillus aceris]